MTHSHISRTVADRFRDADVLLGGYLADALFKGKYLDIERRRWRPDRWISSTDAAQLNLEMTHVAMWNELAAAALERRENHHEKLKKLRPETAGNWHTRFPISNRTVYGHYMTNLRIGPSMVEPFLFSGTYRLATKMPDAARVNMRAFRHAFADKMGFAGWWPTSSGEVPVFEDKYVGHAMAAISRLLLRFSRNLNPFPVEGPWSPDARGWNPVQPERHFSSKECKVLRNRLSQLLANGAESKIFESESISDSMRVRALALAFDAVE